MVIIILIIIIVVLMKNYFGIGASKGVAIGIGVSLDEVNNTDSFDTMLVDQYIPPYVTQLPENVVGIVVEDGGMLSHAACIAREIGIPCVIGVVNAVNDLLNKRIEINGETGEVIEIDDCNRAKN